MDQQEPEVSRITADEAKTRVDHGEPIAFIDTRSPESWDKSDVKIKGVAGEATAEGTGLPGAAVPVAGAVAAVAAPPARGPKAAPGAAPSAKAAPAAKAAPGAAPSAKGAPAAPPAKPTKGKK